MEMTEALTVAATLITALGGWEAVKYLLTRRNNELELMEVYRKTRTVTVTPEPKRWGLGVQAGVGWPSGWYVGVGVSYDLWQW